MTTSRAMAQDAKLTELVNFKLTAAEAERLKAYAAARDVTTSALLRGWVRGIMQRVPTRQASPPADSAS